MIYAHPTCIRPCPAGFRVTIKRHLPNFREKKYVEVFPTLDLAVAARDAWQAANPPTKHGRTDTPRPPAPRDSPSPREPADALSASATVACLAYADAKLAVLATDRSNPRYAPARAAQNAAEERAVVALQRLGGHREGASERASRHVAGGIAYWVDSSGDLRTDEAGRKAWAWGRDECQGRRVCRENGGRGRRKASDLR